MRTDDEWVPWLTFFAVGVHETAERATRQARALIRHYERDREKVRGHALRLADELFRTPCMTVPEAQRVLDVTNPTARSAVRALEAKGLLVEWAEKRWPRVYLAQHVLDAVLHPLEDLRSGPGTAEQGTVVKSEAVQQQKPPRRADRLMAEAMDTIDAARAKGVQLRLTGGLAVRRYCTDLDFMDREYSDIDYVGRSDQKKEMHEVFEELGYTENRYVTQSTDSGQLQYIKVEALEGMKAEAEATAAGVRSPYEPPLVDHVDIFLDVMRMDHDVDVQERLEIDDYAISPADAFIAKMQIGKINQKDVHDVIALVKDVPLRDVDDDASIDLLYIAERVLQGLGAVPGHHDQPRHRAGDGRRLRPHGVAAGPRVRAARGHQGVGRGRQQEPPLAAARHGRRPRRVAPRDRGDGGDAGHRAGVGLAARPGVRREGRRRCADRQGGQHMTGMVPQDVYELTGVADPRLSPDGTTVAYVVGTVDKEADEYRGAIWLAAVDGSTPPRRFTSGEKADADPRWSPDGAQLAFTSNRADKASQLYVMPVAGGEPRKLTSLKEDVAQAVWSPDGARLAFVSRVRDAAYEEEDDKKRRPRRLTRLQYKLDSVGWTADRPQHLFTVPADGSSEPVQLTDGDYEDHSPSWSPDGSTIAFISARHPDWDLEMVDDVYLVAATGGEPRRLTRGGGSTGGVSWAPDGAQLAIERYASVFDDPKHTMIALVDAATGELRSLTAALDRNCTTYPSLREPLWDGDDVVFVVEDRGCTHVYRVAADGADEPRLVVGGERAVSGLDVAAGRLVFTAGEATRLNELYDGGHGRGAGDPAAAGRRLTQVGDGFAAGRELVPAERFTAVSTDGSEVDAWIMRPAASSPARSTRCCSTSTAVPTVSTASTSSTSSRCTAAPATPSSSPTRAAPPARRRRGHGRSGGPARMAEGGAPWTTTTAWPSPRRPCAGSTSSTAIAWA